MRTIADLEKAAFTSPLSIEEEMELFQHYRQIAVAQTSVRDSPHAWKQCAYFAGRAFDKGARDPESIEQFLAAMNAVQKLAPTASFRRKLNEIKAAKAGKNTHEAVLKRLVRAGPAGDKKVLATDAELDAIAAELDVALPPSYRAYLKQNAHRIIGAFEPWTARELVKQVREKRNNDLPEALLPFLEDNADLYCFDLTTTAPEFAIVFYPHDGASDESWSNFAAWVEECWLEEL